MKTKLKESEIVLIFNIIKKDGCSDWRYCQVHSVIHCSQNSYLTGEAEEIALLLWRIHKIGQIAAKNFDKDLGFAEISELATHEGAVLDYILE